MLETETEGTAIAPSSRVHARDSDRRAARNQYSTAPQRESTSNRARTEKSLDQNARPTRLSTNVPGCSRGRAPGCSLCIPLIPGAPFRTPFNRVNLEARNDTLIGPGEILGPTYSTSLPDNECPEAQTPLSSARLYPEYLPVHHRFTTSPCGLSLCSS